MKKPGRKKNQNRAKDIENFIKTIQEDGENVTLDDVRKEFFPDLHPLEGKAIVHSYLHSLRKRKKNPLLIYSSRSSGHLVQMNDEKTTRYEITKIIDSHIQVIMSSWKNRLRDSSNPIVSEKVGFRIGDRLIELGYEIINGIQKTRQSFENPSHKYIEGRQKST